MSQVRTLIFAAELDGRLRRAAARGPFGGEHRAEIGVLLGGLHDGGVRLLVVLLGEDVRHHLDVGELVLDGLDERVRRGSGGWTACCGSP